MTKPQPFKATGEAFDNATKDVGLSSGELSSLTLGLIAYRKAHEKPLNEIERNAVFGMIAYVAYTQHVKKETVAEVMISHFGIDAVAALPSRLYQDAIKYLVELKMDKIVN